MEENKNGQDGFPVFKGLQKPLEFMGIRGRFLTLAAVAIGVSFVGFIAFSIVLGKLAGVRRHAGDGRRRAGHHLREAARRTAQQETGEGNLRL